MAEVNLMLVSIRMEAAMDSLEKIWKDFIPWAVAYDINLKKFWGQAEKLMINEAKFYANPNPAKSKELDDSWSEWAYGIYRRMEDSALDLDFSKENQQLRDFLKLLSTNRATFL